jgi:hypothetical protein
MEMSSRQMHWNLTTRRFVHAPLISFTCSTGTPASAASALQTCAVNVMEAKSSSLEPRTSIALKLV